MHVVSALRDVAAVTGAVAAYRQQGCNLAVQVWMCGLDPHNAAFDGLRADRDSEVLDVREFLGAAQRCDFAPVQLQALALRYTHARTVVLMSASGPWTTAAPADSLAAYDEANEDSEDGRHITLLNANTLHGSAPGVEKRAAALERLQVGETQLSLARGGATTWGAVGRVVAVLNVEKDVDILSAFEWLARTPDAYDGLATDLLLAVAVMVRPDTKLLLPLSTRLR